jgi:predicted N-acetyltransferase YhbS
MPADVQLIHLFEQPQHCVAVARLIHDEFWTAVPDASVEGMAGRLRLAERADRLPLCRVALHHGQPVGAVNLIDSDDDDHPEWSPWLAGMVVAEPWRGRGVGSTLVRTLLDDARRLGLPRVYFGTDGPGFYIRLGAVHHQQPREDFWFMRFDLG